MTSLCTLPGGIGKFVPCAMWLPIIASFGSAWATRRPGETASEAFLNELLLNFGTHLGLLLRCWVVRFDSRVSTWHLQTDRSVANLVTEGGDEVGIVQVEPGGDGELG